MWSQALKLHYSHFWLQRFVLKGYYILWSKPVIATQTEFECTKEEVRNSRNYLLMYSTSVSNIKCMEDICLKPHLATTEPDNIKPVLCPTRSYSKKKTMSLLPFLAWTLETQPTLPSEKFQLWLPYFCMLITFFFASTRFLVYIANNHKVHV